MGALVQTVDIEVGLSGGSDVFPDVLSVVDCEVERVFGGGGSQATIQVVFDDLLNAQQISAFRAGVDGGADDPFFTPKEEIELTVDVTVTDLSPSTTETVSRRIFTGTVVRVIESHKRIVTLEALDYRHQLNKSMVRLDTTEDGAPTPEIVRNILTGEGSVGDGMGLVEGQDFFIDMGDLDPNTRVNESWGVESHATAFTVLQELAYEEAATLHIDRYNNVYFTKFPEHSRYSPEQMPPIVEWESGDEETSEDVIVESEYDETGIGIYAPTSSKPNRDSPPGDRQVGEEIHQNNVFERQAIEKVRASEEVDISLKQNSGVIRCVGDPRIDPYDMFEMNGEVIDGFSPISTGEYMAKTVRHQINNQDGYIVEIELGRDPEELFKEFTGRASRVVFDNWAEETKKKEEEGDQEGGFWSFIPGVN